MKKLIAIAISITALVSVSFVFAEELAVKPESTGNNSRLSKEERTEARNQWKLERQQALENLKQEKATLRATFKEKLTKDRCARIEAKIQARTAKFGSAKIRHMSAYTNLRNRIQKFITRFDSFYKANPDKGTPELLTKLENDFGSADNDPVTTNPATLNSLINAFQASLTDFSAKFNATKKLTCTTTEGEVKSSLVDARTYLQSVHTNAAAIRTYVRTMILPDLLAVKKDIARARGGTEESDDEAKEEEDENENGESETSDTTKPTVSITSPSNTTYVAADTVTISANAADNVGVTKVEFYDGGNLKGEDTASPYSYEWTFAIADNGTHSWTAKAYDAASNTEVSSAVDLTVTIPTLTP